LFEVPAAPVEGPLPEQSGSDSSSSSSTSSTSSVGVCDPESAPVAEALVVDGPDEPMEPVAVAAVVPVAANQRALEVFETDVGVFRLYRNSDLVAHCINDAHNVGSSKCKCTRTTKHSGKLKGRPIGFMYAWLMQAFSDDCHTRDSHVRECKPSFAECCEARAAFYTLPGGQAFSEKVERAPAAGEPDGPEH
jgi:hypothetical protein